MELTLNNGPPRVFFPQIGFIISTSLFMDSSRVVSTEFNWQLTSLGLSILTSPCMGYIQQKGRSGSAWKCCTLPLLLHMALTVSYRGRLHGPMWHLKYFHSYPTSRSVKCEVSHQDLEFAFYPMPSLVLMGFILCFHCNLQQKTTSSIVRGGAKD